MLMWGWLSLCFLLKELPIRCLLFGRLPFFFQFQNICACPQPSSLRLLAEFLCFLPASDEEVHAADGDDGVDDHPEPEVVALGRRHGGHQHPPGKRNTSPAFIWAGRWKLLWCWPGFGLVLLLCFLEICLFDLKKIDLVWTFEGLRVCRIQKYD